MLTSGGVMIRPGGMSQPDNLKSAIMGYLLDSGNPKILCLLVARAREAVSRNSAGRSPGRRRARAHASGGVLRMPCRRAARDGPGTGNQRPFQRGRPVAEATTHGGYLSQVDSPFYREMVDTNILGVYYCMKHEITQMLRQGKGAIVNLASIAGLNGIPWAGPYASTKHAVVGLTKSSALDHATQGVRINAVAPGAIRTDILARQLERSEEHTSELQSLRHLVCRL